MGRAFQTLSRRHFILPTLLAGLMWLAAGCAGPADPRTSIPAIANIAGNKVGYTTMQELEARLGKGKPFTGGHANGGRKWRVRETSWIISADAFDYSKRGIVVDEFDLRMDDHSEENVPFARLEKQEFAWLGGITPGVAEAQALKVLKAASVPVTKTTNGWEASAVGFSRITSTPTHFEKWSTRLEVTNGVLQSVSFDAELSEALDR